MTPEEAWNEFVRCAPWLQKALDRAGNTHELDDIAQGIEEGRFQFWPHERGVIVTEIILYPRKKALNFFLVAGHMEGVLELKEHIETWARGIGCDWVMGSGRRGWQRVLMKDWRLMYTTVGKEL